MFLHINNTMESLLETASVRVSSIQIMQVRVQNKDKGLHSDDEEEPRPPNTGGQMGFPPQVKMVNMIYATHIPKRERKRALRD